MRKIILFLFAILFYTIGYCQVTQNKHPLDAVYKECCSVQNSDFGALNCAIEANQEWNKEINKYYNALMKVLDNNAQNDLKQAQDQWIKYRNLEYKFSNNIHAMKGTMYTRLQTQRNMRIVRTRALELKSYYWFKTEEDEPKVQGSIATQSILQTGNTNLVLPTPDAKFFSELEILKRNNAQYVIEKYIDTYLVVSKAREVIGKAPLSNTEIPGENCLYRTEYKNIIVIEDYGCDSYFETTSIEFSNYNFDEVKEILKILLPKVYKESDVDNYPVDRSGWDESEHYYEYNSNCTLNIDKEENKILVSFGCSC